MVIVKVSLSRKLTRDFNSTGFGLDIQSELPSQTVEDPQAMAQATEHLFQLANDLLEVEVAKAQGAEQPPQAQASPSPTADRNGSGNGHARPQAQGNGKANATGGNGTYRNGNGNSARTAPRANGNGGNRPITEAQVRAATNMARKAKVDVDDFAAQNFNRGLRELTLREASELIDQLKNEIESQQPQGAGR